MIIQYHSSFIIMRRPAQVRRIRKDAILTIVRSWLNEKVGETWNTFQWEGFTMSSREIESVTELAYAAWLAGYR